MQRIVIFVIGLGFLSSITGCTTQHIAGVTTIGLQAITNVATRTPENTPSSIIPGCHNEAFRYDELDELNKSVYAKIPGAKTATIYVLMKDNSEGKSFAERQCMRPMAPKKEL